MSEIAEPANLSRRKLLLVATGIALEGVPVLATGHNEETTAQKLPDAPGKCVPLAGSDVKAVSLKLEVSDRSTLRLYNPADSLIIVRHVSPGLVVVGEKTFDLNSVFTTGSYALRAGTVTALPIRSMKQTFGDTMAGRSLPSQVTQGQSPQRAQFIVTAGLEILAHSACDFYT